MSFDELSEQLFGNIGQKIKKLAIFATILGFVSVILSTFSALSCLLIFHLIYVNLSVVVLFLSIFALLIYAVLGCLFSWLGSFFIYGFGQLIENTDCLRKKN